VLSQIESQVRNQGSKDDVKSRIEKMLKHMENNSISSAKEYLYYQNASNKTVVEALDVVFEKGPEYAKEHGGDICADIQEKAASGMSGEQLQKARTFQNDLWALMNQVGLEKTKKYIQYASEDALTDKTLRISELGTGNVTELDALDSNKVFLMRNKAILMILAIICLIAGIVMLIIRPSEDAQPKLTREQRKQAGQHMGLKTSRIIANSLIHALLIVISVIWLIPFISIVMQSLRVESTYQVGYVMPEKVGFYNYSDLFTTDFPTWYLNTFIMALAVAVLQTLIVLCMSYTLSRFRFKMRKPLMRFMLILGMFPGMLSMIILYRVLKDLGLTQANATPGLILVYVASSGMGYYVSKGFFDTIPTSLDEAARVDGATRAQILYKNILPLSKPIVIYTILTAFMGPWGDYVFARYISFGTSAGKNVAVGLYDWLNRDSIANNYTMFCAGGVLVALPVTILFLFLQKYYVEGVTGGAVKG
jgi:arabinogalactan oligomer/maltooligosaccharide transport system permease protein